MTWLLWGLANNDNNYQKNRKCAYLQSSQSIFQQKLGVAFSYFEHNNNNNNNDNNNDDDDNNYNSGLCNRSN